MDKSQLVYLRGLNGIRAIAATAVLLSHINMSLKTFNISNVSLFGFRNGAQQAWNLGEQGVTIFFVLSGFLITYLLLLENNKKGTINRKHFYIRRILRIWPLYYLYLFLAVIIIYLFSSTLENAEMVPFYIFLLANIPFIIEMGLPACHHLWSIAVEEQFYLFWPFFFKKKIKLHKVLAIIIISCVIIRIMLWIFFPFKLFTVLFTVNRFDCMMLGALVAIYFYENRKIIKFFTSFPCQLFAWIVIAIHFFNFNIINSIISMEFVTLATAIIICGQISSKHKIINLENRLFNFLGKYSYGIYVYHPLFIYILSKSNFFNQIENEIARAVTVFLTVILITLGIAFLSYELIEKKFIKLKDRFSAIHSTNNLKKATTT